MGGEPEGSPGTITKHGDELHTTFWVIMPYGGSQGEGAYFEAQFLQNFPANGFERCFAGNDFPAGKFEHRRMESAGETTGGQHAAPVQDHGANHAQGFGTTASGHGRKSRRFSLSGR